MCTPLSCPWLAWQLYWEQDRWTVPEAGPQWRKKGNEYLNLFLLFLPNLLMVLPKGLTQVSAGDKEPGWRRPGFSLTGKKQPRKWIWRNSREERTQPVAYTCAQEIPIVLLLYIQLYLSQLEEVLYNFILWDCISIGITKKESFLFPSPVPCSLNSCCGSQPICSVIVDITNLDGNGERSRQVNLSRTFLTFATFTMFSGACPHC